MSIEFQVLIIFSGIPLITSAATWISVCFYPTVPTPAHFLWKFSEREMPGLANCGSNRALRKYAYIICQQDALCHLLLRILKVIVETQHSMWRFPLKVMGPTLWAATLEDQAEKSPGKEILLPDWEGLGMNLFLMTRHRCWEALWNHLSQRTFTTSPSDKHTCPAWITTFWQACLFCLLDLFLSCMKSENSKYLWEEQTWRISLCLIYLHTLRVAREKHYFELVRVGKCQIDLVI